HGGIFACACDDHSIRLYDESTRRELAILEGHSGAVTDISFELAGRRLASAADDRTMRLWDTESGRSLSTHEDHGAPVTCVTWSADGRWIASGGRDGSVRIWNSLPPANSTAPGRS